MFLHAICVDQQDVSGPDAGETFCNDRTDTAEPHNSDTKAG